MKYTLTLLLVVISICCFAQNEETVIGCWMGKTNAEHLQIVRVEHNFTFHDYNKHSKAYETLTGAWTYDSGKLTLLYDDRSKQTFTLKKNKQGKYDLTKVGGFIFRKVDAGKCSIDK